MATLRLLTYWQSIFSPQAADKMPRINAALLGSEGVSTAQRERIERAFRTRAYSWYGQSERVVLAGECETDGTYHAFPDYGILEIIDGQRRPCVKGW
jgi:phenylacetate-coenzyme A ligase PaaK-like adenylate-forming protein